MALTGFDTKLNADTAIGAVGAMLMPFQNVSKQIITSGATGVGDTVNVPLVGVADDALEFDSSTNNYFTDNSGGDTVSPVVINKRPKSTFTYTPAQLQKVTPQMLQEKWNTATRKVAKKAYQYLCANLTLVNFPTAIDTVVAADFDASHLNKIYAAMKIKLEEMDNISLVINSSYMRYLMDDSLLASASDFGGIEVARNGVLPERTRGLTVYETNQTPANSINLVGYATDGTGLTFAQTIVDPRSDLGGFDGEYEVAVDPMTGLMFEYSVDWDKDTRALAFTVEMNAGFGKGRTAGCGLIVSA